MKKVLIVIFICISITFFIGCSKSTQVNVPNMGAVSTSDFANFIKIGDKLLYDSKTKIVYFEKGVSKSAEVYMPYIAPNGLPYRYNVNTNTLEEIKNAN